MPFPVSSSGDRYWASARVFGCKSFLCVISVVDAGMRTARGVDATVWRGKACDKVRGNSD